MDREALVSAGRWAESLATRLYWWAEIEGYPPVCRNRQGSYHHRPNGLSQIVFGWQSIERAYERGFTEYATIAHVWRGHGELAGWRGVWALVLHEFAHAMQGDRERGAVHTEGFVEALRDLQEFFPFEKCNPAA